MRAMSGRASLAALALVLAGAAAWFIHYGLQMHAPLPDEFLPVVGARMMHDGFWQTLTSPLFDRGPERLTAVAMWATNHLAGDTPGEFRAAHVAFSTAWVLAAIPTYALARGLGVRPWAAAIAGALAVITPFAVYASTLLNVTLAYPLAMALFWAIWRTTVRPSLGADALVLLVGALNVLTRTAHGPFIAVAAIAVIVQALRAGPPGETPWRAMRRLPARLFMAHPLLVVAGVAVLGAVVVVGPHGLVGSGYGSALPHGVALHDSNVLHKAALWLSVLTLGTAFLPMMVGGPWLVREALRPRAPETGAFAVVALSAFAIFLYTSLVSTEEERYVAVLAALPIVACAAALTRRQGSLLGVAVAGVLLTRAVVTTGLMSTGDPYSFFTGPARQFFTRVVAGQLAAHLPVAKVHVATIALLLALGGALIAVAAMSPRPRLTTGVRAVAFGAVLALVCALSVAGSDYSARKFYSTAGLPGTPWSQETFIDRATGQKVSHIYGYNMTNDLVYEAQLAQFFNHTYATFGGDMVGGIEPHTGVLRGAGLGPWLVTFDTYHPVVFDGTKAASSTVFGPIPVVVQRSSDPPRAALRFRGLDAAGWLRAGRSARMDVFAPAARRGRCLEVDLLSPAGGRPSRWALDAPGGNLRGQVAAGKFGTVRVPLAGARTVTLRASGGGTLPDQGRFSVGIGQARTVDC
jgi:hypothetical protein